MKNTILTTICSFLMFWSFSQDISERYEHATFLVSKGQSAGAVTTDFEMTAGLMDASMIAACNEAFYSKDLIFDVAFIQQGSKEIIRVYHLEEMHQDDLKILFVNATNTTEFAIQPSKFFKIDSNRGD